MKKNAQFSSNALVVLKKRYLKKNRQGEVVEDPQQFVERVALAIASIEKKYGGSPDKILEISRAFSKMISQLEFMPNSPTLMNAGRELGQLSACFVLPVDDSMESIFDAIKFTALVHKTGGGTGFSFSRLRPSSSVVQSTGGVASGPVSFMKVFDAATQAVKQGGTRRGANMGILRVDHPDILEFIKCKSEEGTISNFNISVAITDEFMDKYFKSEDYDLIDPRTKEVVGTLNAKKVFDLIAEYAHKNGEPGIIFIDKINQSNKTPQLGAVESTNPCLPKDTWIMTQDGPQQINELIGKPFTAVVDSEKYPSSEQGFFSTGVKPVYTLTTKEGFSLRLTLDHPLLKVTHKTRKVIKTEWVQAGDLNSGDTIMLNEHRTIEWDGEFGVEQGYLMGLLIGDGTVKKEKAVFSSWGDSPGAQSVRRQAMHSLRNFESRSDFSGWQNIASRNEYRLSLASVTKFANEVGIIAGNKEITTEIEKGSSQFYCGFLRGLFDADGTVIGTQEKGVSVRLAQSNGPRLQTVQRMLLRLGIYSKIYYDRRKSGLHLLPDGKGGFKEYTIKAQHELVISGSNLAVFSRRIGFSDIDKQDRLEKSLQKYKRNLNRNTFLATVRQLSFDGMQEVFDAQIPQKHAFDANGFVAHNCGEQPLLPYESCNLGSINLAKVLKEVDGKFVIDWDHLKEITQLATRFLDNVIDVNKFPIPQIKENTLKTRKIGLGIMGWATLLGYCGISYDSDEAIDLAKKVIKFIYEAAKEQSQQLAKERGVFPAWVGSQWQKHGVRIRNATLTTIAPTGTISIIAGPTSSGIEPNFSLGYFRNILDGEKLLEMDPAFEYVAKKRGFYSEELMEKIALGNSIQQMQEIPDDVKRVFRTAMEITPYWHIKMQAAFQEYTDNAVSKTINLPNRATIDDVKEAYLLSYRLGCKGITVYRDGSRSVQVLTTKKNEIQSAEAPVQVPEIKSMYPQPRSEVIFGTTTKVSTGCGNLYITLNQDDRGNFFEVFTQMGKAGGCAASQLEAVGRLISLALRGGVDIKVVVEQLKGIRCPSPSWAKGQKIFSCADAIARALEKRANDQKKIVKDIAPAIPQETTETKVAAVATAPSVATKKATNTIVGVCPDCGSALRHQEGCMLCDACGYSKC